MLQIPPDPTEDRAGVDGTNVSEVGGDKAGFGAELNEDETSVQQESCGASLVELRQE